MKDALEDGWDEVQEFSEVFNPQFASASSILEQAAGQELKDYLLDGNIAGLVNDLLDADWKKVEFIESIGTSLPIELDTELLDASVYLSV